VIRLKTADDIAKIRQAGRAVAAALGATQRIAAPGVTTRELDEVAEQAIRSFGAEPAFKGQRGKAAQPFPASICTSINDEVVHGIPGDRKLAEGDLLSVDVGARWEGHVADAARTYAIGRLSKPARRLMDVCLQALQRAISRVHVGVHVLEIGGTVEDYAVSHGMSVVRELVGHGVGYELWEEPQVPNFRSAAFPDPALAAGTVIAIEPMICAGSSAVVVDRNGWTVRTADGSLSAHFENSIAVTDTGAVVLTLP